MSLENSRQRLLNLLEMDTALFTSSIPIQCDILGETVPLDRIINLNKKKIYSGTFTKKDLQWMHFLREELKNKVKTFTSDVKSSKMSIETATLKRNYILGIKTAYLPNRAFSLIAGSILITISYLIQKRKKLGLISVYIACSLNIIIGATSAFIFSQEESPIIYVLFIVVQILWIKYFYKRRSWFN